MHKKYWDFSFHEKGLFDQPALWNFVMKETQQKSISYICHSEGFTQMLVSMMAYPEFYKKHMNICLAFAPVWTITDNKIDLIHRLAGNRRIVKLFEQMCP